MDANTFLIQVVNGIQHGLLLFLVASGLTLILVKGARAYAGSTAELRAQPELRVKYLGV